MPDKSAEPESICRFAGCGEPRAPYKVFCDYHFAANYWVVTWPGKLAGGERLTLRTQTDAYSDPEDALKVLDTPSEWMVRLYKRLTPLHQAALKKHLADFEKGQPLPRRPAPDGNEAADGRHKSMREANCWILLEYLATQ